jgi:hypothetical protein
VCVQEGERLCARESEEPCLHSKPLHPTDGGSTPRYSAALVVLLAEILKLCISLACFVYPACRSQEAWDGAVTAVKTVVTTGSCLRFSIPAIVYMLENHIRFAVLKVRPSACSRCLLTRTFVSRHLENRPKAAVYPVSGD